MMGNAILVVPRYLIYFPLLRYYYWIMLKTPEKSPFYTQGLRFSCVRCSTCCRFESGFVFLSCNDASLLSDAFNMGKREFAETYCRWVHSENGAYLLSLKEKSNRDCIFWSAELSPRTGGEVSRVPAEGCLVYDSRPLQCRSFPFWESVLNDKCNWEMTAQGCPGMDSGAYYSKDSIEKWLAARQKEPIMSRSYKD